MATNDELLALAEELEAVSLKDDCESCLASGTGLCRGDLECAESAHKACAKRLREIVEHDECEVTTVSAYDLLSEEDREALAWVREMGGANALSMGFQDADNRRIELCSSLGIDLETGWADAMVAMRRRLMPEGMEWPKVDGKPVDFKTAYGPSLGVLEAVSIYNTGSCQVMSHDGIIKSAKDIHIVKPKVLDADGVEIREGDVLYSVETGDYVVVDSIEPGNPWFATTDCALQHCAKFTHRAPVLAADGEPLRKGETVYSDGLGEGPFTVREIKPDDDPDEPEHTVWCGETIGSVEDGAKIWRIADQLTHEQPDTWDRLFADACKGTCGYYGRKGCESCPALNEESCMDAMLADLVRRARKLAERGE